VENGVGDGRRDTHHRELTDPFRSERVDADPPPAEYHLHRWRRVSVNAYCEVGETETGVRYPSVARIDDGGLQSAIPMPPIDGAEALGAGDLGLMIRPSR
jgi:hypothetical protein